MSAELREDLSERFRSKPAISRICCCSVTAATGFVAAYILVTYAIGIIYELVWLIESDSGLPVPSLLLMMCYCIIIAATIVLVHALMSKNNAYLMAWLIAIILVLIPECCLVFYMSISYWGLQSVYGSAELVCYVARLPAIVIGILLVQSAYALRHSRLSVDCLRKSMMNSPTMMPPSSEFDASHYVPDSGAANLAFVNDGFIEDNGKVSSSMPDLRRHLAANALQPPPAYWQHMAAERQHAASMRSYNKPYPMPQMYGTWYGPRRPQNQNYKRRHSVVGAFNQELQDTTDYEFYDQTDTKSEMNYPRYGFYERELDPRFLQFNQEYDPRYSYGNRYEDTAYGVNLYRNDPYNVRDRVFYGPNVRNSSTSFGTGRSSDDLHKYKDVAL